MSWDELKRQLSPRPCLGSPVVFGWKWTDSRIGMRHLMVAYGYEELDGERWVRMVDPLSHVHSCRYETKLITYDEYKAGSDHQHTQDVHDVRSDD